MSAYEIENRVFQTDSHGRHYYRMVSGQKRYIYKNVRQSPYAIATIDSMIDPQPYSAGTYPYGYCVTDGGNTYQVNNYSGTSEALVHADWDDLGAGISFTPVSTPADLNAVRSVSTRVFGTGTKWQAEYTTTGLAGHYIQVADIDLKFDTQNENGAYYNSGAGWLPIGGTFLGTYKGEGKIINGLFVMYTGTNATQRRALFSINEGNISGVSVVNCNITGYRYVAAICGQNQAGTINDCFAHGIIRATNTQSGGLVGNNAATISNCLTCVAVISTQSYAGGAIGWGSAGVCSNVVSFGSVNAPGPQVGGLIGQNDGTVTASYYNTETSGQSDTEKGTPKTTAELLAGTPSAGIYTDWDENIWDFQAGKYPIHKFFGELGISLPPPTDLNATENAGDIDLTWTAPDKTPKGYHVFKSVDDGAWEQVNTELITDTNYSFTPSGTGLYNFFVVAVYYNKVYGADQSTGNSITTVEEII